MLSDDKNEITNNAQDSQPQSAAADQPAEQASAMKEKTISLKESEYHKLVTEAAEFRDKYLRLFAEFDNARKRMEKDRQDTAKYAGAALLSDFLNILDDLERSVEAAEAKHEDYSAFLKGIEMVMAHIYEMLKKNSVKTIETLGRKFDPNYHEILMLSEKEDAKEGEIIEEFQKGYLMGDRVLRTAKVHVVKCKDAAKENTEEKQLPTEQ